MATTSHNENKKEDFFSSLVSDIKSYNGNDPLRPWLQGIKKMKQNLPSHALQEKLPRFLQKCVETFVADRRYKNDSRYIRVWLQLMDYVDDAKAILRKMEKNHIGSKRATFYTAYALYYEKHKKFQEAEKMFRLGVQNLAEPADELQKSYDQFLHRKKLHEERKTKKLMQLEKKMVSGCRTLLKGETSKVFYIPTFGSEDQSNTDNNSKEMPATEDTIAVKRFVGKAITEKTEAEDTLHHGLVDPTINMKEAMNTISDMFKEPLDLETIARRRNSRQSKPKENQKNSVLDVFIDSPAPQKNQNQAMAEKPSFGAFKIWTDEDDKVDDTVVKNFMGSNEEDDGRVENACHNGLVDPTVNMKEAMDDINVMFGEPGNLIRARRGKEQDALKMKSENQGFCILADDDLFEPTVCTREAMTDINEMFGKSLDL